jgi:nucleoid DNA-binding protein
MVKKDLANIIQDVTNVEYSVAENAVEVILERIKSELARGAKLEIRGFGTMYIHHQKAKVGQDINRKKCVSIPSCKVPKFRASKKFFNKCNE